MLSRGRLSGGRRIVHQNPSTRGQGHGQSSAHVQEAPARFTPREGAKLRMASPSRSCRHRERIQMPYQEQWRREWAARRAAAIPASSRANNDERLR